MNVRFASAAVLLCAAWLFSTPASASCGAEGEPACNIKTRIPSCDVNLIETAGSCWRPACGQEGQRGCGPTERITFNLLLRLPVPQTCDADLVHVVLANRCRHPNCGREGGPPCTVLQRIPSCDINLAESGGRCVRPLCGALDQRACSPTTLGALSRPATIYSLGQCDVNLVVDATNGTCRRPGSATQVIAATPSPPPSTPISPAPAAPAPAVVPPPPGIRMPTPPPVASAPPSILPPPPLPAVVNGGTSTPPGMLPPPPVSSGTPPAAGAADGGYTAGYQAGYQAGFSAGRAAVTTTPTVMAQSPNENPALLPEPGGAFVRAARSTFASGENIKASFAGLPGNKGDWIAIAAAGAPDNSYLEWSFLGGRQSGAHSFSQRFKPGQYEIRLFEDWPAGKYEVVSRATFTVQ